MERSLEAIRPSSAEVHKVTVARQVLRDYQPHEGLFPNGHLLARREQALERYGALLEHEVGEA